MKRIYVLFIALTVIFFSTTLNSRAGDISVWFFGGLSTPNDDLSMLYNEKTLDENFETPASFLIGATDFGWHLGINPRIGIGEDTYLDISVSYTSFPASTTKVLDPETGTNLPFFDTKTSVVPIKVGVDYYLIHSLVGVYVKGDIGYNYISNSITNIKDLYEEITTLENQTFGRFGAGVGLGVDVNLPLLMDVGVELEYNWMNLIGKEDNEADKNYLGVSLRVGL